MADPTKEFGFADLAPLIRHPVWIELEGLLARRQGLYRQDIRTVLTETPDPVIAGTALMKLYARMDELDYVLALRDRVAEAVAEEESDAVGKPGSHSGRAAR